MGTSGALRREADAPGMAPARQEAQKPMGWSRRRWSSDGIGTGEAHTLVKSLKQHDK